MILHLAMCRGCRTYIEQLRLTLRALHSGPRAAPAVPGRDALLGRFREHHSGGGDGGPDPSRPD